MLLYEYLTGYILHKLINVLKANPMYISIALHYIISVKLLQ